MVPKLVAGGGAVLGAIGLWTIHLVATTAADAQLPTILMGSTFTAIGAFFAWFGRSVQQGKIVFVNTQRQMEKAQEMNDNYEVAHAKMVQALQESHRREAEFLEHQQVFMEWYWTADLIRHPEGASKVDRRKVAKKVTAERRRNA